MSRARRNRFRDRPAARFAATTRSRHLHRRRDRGEAQIANSSCPGRAVRGPRPSETKPWIQRKNLYLPNWIPDLRSRVLACPGHETCFAAAFVSARFAFDTRITASIIAAASARTSREGADTSAFPSLLFICRHPLRLFALRALRQQPARAFIAMAKHLIVRMPEIYDLHLGTTVQEN